MQFDLFLSFDGVQDGLNDCCVSADDRVIGKGSHSATFTVVLITERVGRTESVRPFGSSFGATSRLVATGREKGGSVVLQTFDRLTVSAPLKLPGRLIDHVFFTDATIQIGDVGMPLQQKQPLSQFFSCSASLGCGVSFGLTSFA